ncbi:MAG: hypothetical protein KCHDKBKB_00528 [Elusimicrobia bacterium]|nr:hypothetical protein [Elusimicrobiota bacterium]
MYKLCLIFSLMAMQCLSACKKEKVAQAPAPVEVAPPVATPVVPGMEHENPAEKEGMP